MRLTYDLDHDILIRGLHAPARVERLELKSRTAGPVECLFVRPLLSAEALDAAAVIQFGVKAAGAHAGAWLASNWDGSAYAHTLTGTGASAVYALPISWDSTELRALLATADYLDLAGVLKVSEPARTREALDFTVRVYRSYVDGFEGFPTEPNPDPADFEQVIHKGAAGGYAPLDEAGQVPSANLPAFSALTADQLAALAGTSGAPSASNKFVTNADSRMTDARTPSGGAGGVLSGSYPNPGFAVDMATQAELDSGLAGKAATSHTHAIADVTSLQAALDARQPLATNLTTWAGITPAAGVGTFLGAPNTANLAGIVSTTGSGSLVLASGATIASPTISGLMTVGSGAAVGIGAGSTLTISGTLTGTPSGGTLNLAGVTLTLPASFLTATGTQTVSAKTLSSTNTISPAAIMMPHRVVVVGDSMSNSGTSFWPANFSGTTTGLSGSPNSYNVVYSYTGGGSPAYNATGVAPATSWPEQFIATAGASKSLLNFAHAGRYASGIRQYWWQEAHAISPRLTGTPAALVLFAGINDLFFDDAATVWSRLQDIARYAREDGYSPIVLVTLPSSSDGDASYKVGGTWDARRLTLNASITGSSGVADVIVDVTAIAGLQATNTPTTGQSYTHNATYYYDSIHWTAAGNALFAAALNTAIKASSGSIPSRTQAVPTTLAALSYSRLAPWARRRVLPTEFTAASSGGDVYTGESALGAIGIRNGAAASNYSTAYYSPQFIGAAKAAWNGGNLSGKERGRIDWGRPTIIEFSFAGDFGGNAITNTAWQLVYGRAHGATPALIANGDIAIGLKITSPSANVLNIYAVASNGTTATTSALLASVVTGVGANVQLRTDGYGNLFVVIDGVETTLAGIAPTAGTSSSRSLSLEAVTSGTEANNGYLYFSPVDITAL